jgi:hypothetical protein
VPPDIDGVLSIEVAQGGRIEVQLPLLASGAYDAFLDVAGERRPLPLGSSFDAKAGIFYWQPAPAFLGAFELVFDGTGGDPVRVRVVVKAAVTEGRLATVRLDPQGKTGRVGTFRKR